MQKTTIEALEHEDVFKLIGKEWMLITAGNSEKFNTMTASWGGLGWLWNRPVAFIFVRPERYTHEFIEREERLTLSFFGKEHREALNVCGTKSGRDCDKVRLAGLHPVVLPSGTVGFDEARLTIEGRKAYRGQFRPENFLDKEALDLWYNDKPGGGLHDVYIVEIENVYSY